MEKCNWCGYYVSSDAQGTLDGLDILEKFCSQQCCHQYIQAGYPITKKHYGLNDDQNIQMRKQDTEMQRMLKHLKDLGFPTGHDN